LRAWRWKILIAPLCRTTVAHLLGPTFVGFTAIALLGRPGEFARPYLIARKENLPVASQLATWAVERIFDVAAFGLIVVAGAFTINVHSIRYLERIRNTASVILAIAIALAIALLVLQRRWTWLRRVETPVAGTFRGRLIQSIRTFAAGVAAIQDGRTLFNLSALSLVMWYLIALGYAAILHAFPPPVRTMPFGEVTVLMASSALGGLVPLPASATAQLLIVAILLNVFRLPAQLAIGAGTMLWLAGNMAPVPVGLVYLRTEHVNLLTVSRQSRVETA